MDLRPYNPTPAQLAIAADLACRGLMCYQPFVFSDDLQTGAGYEFSKTAEGAGLVYCKNPPPEFNGNSAVERFLIDPALKDDFAEHNKRLRVFYEYMIDLVGEKVAPIPSLTMADVGCCSGYFPLAFSKRGAKRAVGYDLVDYSKTYLLLNSLLGTNAEFFNRGYLGALGGVEKAETFDVVFSIAVLVHLSDPLQHLAFLGKIARKAMVVWTWTTDDPDTELLIRFKSANRYYANSKFPYCFDLMQISPGLLRQSLELMGFTEIYPFENPPGGMPDYWFDRHRGYLAVRPDAVIGQDSTPTVSAGASLFGEADKIPRLVTSYKGYNIVSVRGVFLGIPQSMGPMDLTNVDVSKLEGVLIEQSPDDVLRKLAVLPD